MYVSVRHCNTLQHTATHCNTLQHTATHCKTLQHTTTCMYRQETAARCNTLQHTATYCNTLQHTATHYTSEKRFAISTMNGSTVDIRYIYKYIYVHLRHPVSWNRPPCNWEYSLQIWRTETKNKLQHAATHFNTIQHTATHCNTLQHAATRCNTLQPW